MSPDAGYTTDDTITEAERPDLPHAIGEGELFLCGIRIRTAVLDDGRRIINAEDVHALFAAMQSGISPSPEEAHAYAMWSHGGA